MKIKGSLIGALALTAVLGISNLGVVNADDSSNIETTPLAVEYNENSNYTEKDNNTSQDEYRSGCSNQQRGQGKGQQRGQGGQLRNSYFMKSVQELAQSGVLSEQDVANIQEYQTTNRGQHHNRMNGQSCTRVDELVSKNIITEEQGIKLKQTMDKKINNLEK